MRATSPLASRPFHLRRNHGSVILLVLVTVLLAAFLLTRFVARAGTELLADARAGDQVRLRREAYSALETTLAVLADIRAIDHGLFSPVQGWDRPLDYAQYHPGEGVSVEVAIEDESGKLSLPQTDPATLEALLVSLGLERSAARRASEALLVWTRNDYTPVSLDLDGSAYDQAEPPYEAPHRPLRSFGELAAVEVVRDYFFDETGQPTQLARDFKAKVSLYSFARMNLNSASPVALATGGLNLSQIDALAGFARRNKTGVGYFRTTGEAADLLGSNAPLDRFGTEVQALHITVTVHGGATTYRLEAVVAPPGGAMLAPALPSQSSPMIGTVAETATAGIKKLDYPFKVLEIKEDVEAPAAQPAYPAEHD